MVAASAASVVQTGTKEFTSKVLVTLLLCLISYDNS